MGYERLISRIRKNPSLSPQNRHRIRAVTGLSRSDYLSLVAVVDVVLDPVTLSSRGVEFALLPAIEIMTIGTPIVTMCHSTNLSRNGTTLGICHNPTGVSAIIDAVGGHDLLEFCVASSHKSYVQLVKNITMNKTLRRSLQLKFREGTPGWIEFQNGAVISSWSRFFTRVEKLAL